MLACRRDHPDNLDLFTRIVSSPLFHLLNTRDLAGLQALLAELLGDSSTGRRGAGPADPGRRLSHADQPAQTVIIG